MSTDEHGDVQEDAERSEAANGIAAADPTAGLPDDLDHLDIVVVRDPVYSGGGGIEVVAAVARYLDAPIYTLRQTDPVEAYRELEVTEFKQDDPLSSRLCRRFGARRLLTLPEIHEYENWRPPRDADVIVTVGTRAQHVIHHAHQHRIHFFFTPPRWLWDLFHRQWDDKFRPLRWLMLFYSGLVRSLDVASTQRFDAVLAGSEIVKQRVESYYDIDADVAYCPVDSFEFEHSSGEGYYLMLTRIVPEKRVKLVIEAFNELELPLKIAGTPTGSSQEYDRECRELAGENVEFVGWVEGDEKHELLSNCEALVFAAEREDFGMPPIEALAAGKPVIGVREGYTKHQIEEGRNGVLFDPSLQELITAVETHRNRRWDAAEIQSTARPYDTRAVRQQWNRTLRKLDSR